MTDGVTRKVLKILGIVLLILLLGIAYLFIVRPTPQDLGLRLNDAASPAAGGVVVRWLGVSTLVIEDGTTRLMTDGFISRPSLLDLALDRPVAPDENEINQILDTLAISKLDAIMTVHSHYDHAMDTGVVARLTGARVLGSPSTANVARGAGVPESQITEVIPGDAYRFGQFTVRFFSSRHAPLNDGGPPMPGVIDRPLIPPQPISAWKEGGSYSIVIDHPKGSLLVQGSAGFEPGALTDIETDAVFLGAGGLPALSRSHLNEYIEQIVQRTGPEQVYLIHHEDFITAPFGEIRLLPSLVMDETFVFELQQLVLPAQLFYLRFNQPVVIGPAH